MGVFVNLRITLERHKFWPLNFPIVSSFRSHFRTNLPNYHNNKKTHFVYEARAQAPGANYQNRRN